MVDGVKCKVAFVDEIDAHGRKHSLFSMLECAMLWLLFIGRRPLHN
ncbi:hypothetical protein KUC_2414 [Vreelandella boliviensis LC1]|uniref:Uncharacterized protein n=1 Tax=Vreelandella boliviensis LC1 TaxID=1072583 RepID=A0A7U9GFL7_9GAMM|nr:hypothetical protein KUC_2414 [Halomonas boliviensis LC1]